MWYATERVEERRNAQLREHGKTVWEGLLAYTLDQDCCYRYPSAREVEAELTGPGNYLPGRRLPPNPWADPPRPIRLVHDHLPSVLPTLAELQAGTGRYADWKVVESLVVGPGRMPDAAPPDAYTYGVLVYLVGPTHAVLFGIGQSGDKARVVYFFNNMGGWSALPTWPWQAFAAVRPKHRLLLPTRWTCRQR